MTPVTPTPPDHPEPASVPWFREKGDRVGEYTICRPIGDGGGGIVYEVENEEGARFALKLSRSPLAASGKNPVQCERLSRSAMAHLAAVDVANVAKYVSYSNLVTPHGAFPYLVMELVPDSESITAWAERTAPTMDNLVEVFIYIATTLGKLAELGICHRDLKPQNILIAPGDNPMIVDLDSVSLPMQKPITAPAASAIPGTPAYFSPELAAAVLKEMRTGEAAAYPYAPTDDVYSLGCVFYQVLVGELPDCELNQPLETILNRKVRSNPPHPRALNDAIPWSVNKVVMRMLNKDPAKRYQSGHEVEDELLTARHQTVEASWHKPFIVSRPEVSLVPPHLAPVESSAEETLPESAPEPVPAQIDAPQGPADRAEVPAAPAEAGAPPADLAAAAGPQLARRPGRWRAVKLALAAMAVVVALVAGLVVGQDCPPEDSSAEKGPSVLCQAKTFITTAAFAMLSCVGIKKSVVAENEEWFAQCPAEARETLKKLKMDPNYAKAFPEDEPNVRRHRYGVELRAGPVEIHDLGLSFRLGSTSLVGEIRTDSNGASVRFTKLKLLDRGEEYPVCGIGYGAGSREAGFRKRVKGDPNWKAPMDPASELHPEEGFIYVERRTIAIWLACPVGWDCTPYPVGTPD